MGYHISEIISHFQRNDTCFYWPLFFIYSSHTSLVIRMCKLSPESLWPKVKQKSDVLSPDLPASAPLRDAWGWGWGRQSSWQPVPREATCTEMGRFSSKHSSKPCKEVPRGWIEAQKGPPLSEKDTGLDERIIIIEELMIQQSGWLSLDKA